MTRAPRRLFLLALVLCQAPAPPNSTAGSFGASDAIRRWNEAVFANGDSLKVRSVVLRGDVTEAGIAGRFESRLERGTLRRVTTYGGRTREEVFGPGGAWVKDWNGKVQELVGRDRREAMAEARIESLVFGGAIRDLAAEREVGLADTEDRSVLRFLPPGGSPFDVALDPATGLPSKAVRRRDDRVVTLEFSDWRSAGGIRVPFSVRESDGEDPAGSETTLREVVPSRRRAAAAFNRPADGPRDYRFAKGSSAQAIPFNFENEHLMVEGKVNGTRGVWFMIDTGAGLTIVNKARLPEMGLESLGATSITGGGGSADLAYADVSRMEIGGVEMLGQRVGVMDLRGLERIYGMPMGGILGYDFLSRFVVRVDYDLGTLDLLEPSGYVYRGAGSRVPFLLEGERPHVSATITVADAPPIVADLIVDCGAAGTVNLNAPFVEAHRLLERARKTPAGAPRTLAGSEKEFFAQTSVPGRLAGFALSTFKLKDVPASLMVGTTGAYASKSFSGVIGQGVLGRFNTIYDYSRSSMILEPRAGFDAPFPPRKSFGATLLSDSPDYTVFTVTGVTAGSPAESAGLKKGDVIASVDGKPASELRLVEVRRCLVEDGAHRVLDVRRGSENVTLDFTVMVLTAKDD